MEESKQVEVTYKFFLPDNQHELIMIQNARKYSSALWDIHDLCRTVWKYEESPSEDRVKLAEKIEDIISETGIHED